MSPPVVYDGCLYFMEDGLAKAVSLSDFSLIWNNSLKDHNADDDHNAEGTILIVPGSHLFAAYRLDSDVCLYCLDLDTGAL